MLMLYYKKGHTQYNRDIRFTCPTIRHVLLAVLSTNFTKNLYMCLTFRKPPVQ